MLLGALVDAGLPLDELRGALARLPIAGYSVNASIAQRGVIRGTHISVDLDPQARAGCSIQDFLDMVEASGLSRSVKDKSAKGS